MHTFSRLTKDLNRFTVYLTGLNPSFEMRTVDDAGSVEACRASTQIVANLHTQMISDEMHLQLCLPHSGHLWLSSASIRIPKLIHP